MIEFFKNEFERLHHDMRAMIILVLTLTGAGSFIGLAVFLLSQPDATALCQVIGLTTFCYCVVKFIKGIFD